LREREREENYKSVKHERRHPKSDYGVAKRRTTPTKKKEKNFLIFPFCSPAPSSFPVLSLSLSLSLSRARLSFLYDEKDEEEKDIDASLVHVRAARREEKKKDSLLLSAHYLKISRGEIEREITPVSPFRCSSTDKKKLAVG